MRVLTQEVLILSVKIKNKTRFIKSKKRVVETTRGNYEAKYIVNIGGLYADTIARQFGF
jgi:L-2-hydroxyglutarate oxidase LhgO